MATVDATETSVRCAPRYPVRRASHGFTLIELIVTVAIAAILLTLGVPSFLDAIARNRVAGVTNELSAALHLARSEAVKRGVTVTVCKSSDLAAAVTATTPACDTTNSASWPDGWLVFVDGGTQGIRDGTSDTLLRIGQPSVRNSIQAGDDFKKFVTYRPNGASMGTGNVAARSLTVCIAPEQRTIAISRTGQITVTQGSCS